MHVSCPLFETVVPSLYLKIDIKVIIIAVSSPLLQFESTLLTNHECVLLREYEIATNLELRLLPNQF